MQVTMFDVKNELRNMGFSNSEDRHLMAVACTLYAEGVHKMKDVLSEMSNLTGLDDRNIRTKMDRALKSAWSREVHNPRKMYDTRITRRCPPLKKFIKRFVESVMEGNIDD